MSNQPKFKVGDRVEANCCVLPLLITEVEFPISKDGSIWYFCTSDTTKPQLEIFREADLTLLPKP